MGRSEKYWFPAKRYGWGWGLPSTWQGWLVLGVYLLGLVVLSRFLSPSSSLPMFLLCALGWSVALLVVCWRKGEPPRWRWGE